MNEVRISLAFSPDEPIGVGRLLRVNKKIFFAFDEDFPERGYNLSPIRLPLQLGPQTPDTGVFDGLFGVFADSLPDGWGRLLTDRAFAANGVAPRDIDPLLRLCAVGSTGPGALRYEPHKQLAPLPLVLDDLDVLAAESSRLLADDRLSDHALRQLVPLGGSSGGARPKILAGYHPETGAIVPDATLLAEGFEHWIIKFTAREDGAHAAEVEEAYATMARAAGLKVAETKLFRSTAGRHYFGTKRFDRGPRGERIHLHSAAGLLHDNFRLPAIDYGHLMDAAIQVTQTRAAAETILRQATFNVLSHNRDDHSKNFAFLMDARGEWSVSPAFDLTYARSSHGEHSITVAGEGRAPGKAQLAELARTFEVSRFETLFEEVRAAVADWSAHADRAGVPARVRKEIGRVLGG